MSNNEMTHDDERFIARFVDAARDEADDARIEQAAARFRARLPETQSNPPLFRLPRLAALAVLITGLALTLPVILPKGGGTAFAQVQQWFSSYSTIETMTRISSGEAVVVDVGVQATAAGDVRIEQGGIVQIVRAGAGTMTTLLPGQRYLSQPIDTKPGGSAGLDWVEKLRAFRGAAEPLDDVRVIDGMQATAHRLVIDGTDLILWSHVADDRPLLLEGTLPGGLRLEGRFAFNKAIPAERFDVPADYRPVDPD